jgi:hypothetical protein
MLDPVYERYQPRRQEERRTRRKPQNNNLYMPSLVAKSMRRAASSFWESNSKVGYSKTDNPKHMNCTYCIVCF